MLSKKHSSCSSMGEPSIFSNPANREFIPSKKVSLSIQKSLSRTIQKKSLLRTLNPIVYKLYFEIKTESGHLSLMKKKNGRSTIYSLGFVQDLLKIFSSSGFKNNTCPYVETAVTVAAAPSAPFSSTFNLTFCFISGVFK